MPDVDRSAPGDDLALLVRAAEFAALRHGDQRRMNTRLPYIVHPLGVAKLLVDPGGVRDAVTLTAAILHDTVEDTSATEAEVRREFGEEVARVVLEVSDDKDMAKVDRKRHQIAHAAEISERARIVKLADKLSNLRDLALRPPVHWQPLQVRGYLCWAYAVVEAIGPANQALWDELQALFASTIRSSGDPFRAVPESAAEREQVLVGYYQLVEQLDRG